MMEDQGEQVLVEMKGGRRFRWEVSTKDQTCRRCGAPIWFIVTHKGKRMPIDEPAPGAGVTASHFDTCQSQPSRV